MKKIMDPHTYAKALRELEEAGFITKEQHGGLYRRRNVFKLSEAWRGYDQTSTVKNHIVTDVKSHIVGTAKQV
jgi:DNA-binding transcriptional regulator YhcF (GntR family)